MDQVSYVITSLFFTSLALSFIFFMAWRAFGRPKHALTWSVAFAVGALQWAFNVAYASGWITNFNFYWPVVNFLGALVPVLAIAGYRQRAEKYLNIPVLAGLVLLSLGGTMWFTFLQPHLGLRTAILPYMTTVTSLWTAWIIFDVPRPKRSLEWGLIFAYLLLTLAEFIIGSIWAKTCAPSRAEILNFCRSERFT